MDILVVGLRHKTAPVEIRERVAFAPTAMEKPLREMLALPAVSEGVIVSTCNRVELYATSRDPEAALSQLRRFLAEVHGLVPETLEEHLYEYRGEEAIHHVFRVAASLDSMVIGEPQILGQIKTAYGYAAEFKTVGLILNRFLHKAFSVAKRVRTETEIASNAVSVSFAAVELARTENEESDVVENTARFTRVIEDYIRAHPDQWPWVHKRWKTRPPGEKPIYPF